MRPVRSRFAFLRRFWRHERGNFAMMFGLMAIPLLGIVGLGIDLTRAYIVQVRLQGAVDNAALAAATLIGHPEDEVIALTKRYFASNYHSDFWAPPLADQPKVEIDEDGTVHVTATASVQNYFLQLFGDQFKIFDVKVAADAVGEANGLEIALVLDITSSMNDSVDGGGTKMQAMKIAAKDLVDILFGDQVIHDKLKIGVVPFAASVRLDPATALADGWIDTTGASSTARTHFDNSLANNYAYAMYTQYMNNTPWQGCVEARPNGLEETDTPPDAGTPDTLWVPYFSPDNPDNSVSNPDYPNNYGGNDISTGTKLQRQMYSAKYQGVSGGNNFGSTSGPNRWCIEAKIQPLNNNRDTIKSYIDDLEPMGYTEVQLGVGWGWRILSPDKPFTQGKPYNDPEWSKAIIILTDGDNRIGDEWEDYPPSGNFDINGTTYSAYGFGKDYRIANNTNTVDQMETALDGALARTCANIKAVKKSPGGNDAIVVYTIAFGDDIKNVGIKQVLEGCATSVDNYFEAPSKEDLQAAFQKIGTELSKIRLTK